MHNTEQERRADLYHAFNDFICDARRFPSSHENTQSLHGRLTRLLKDAEGIVDTESMHKNGNWIGPDLTNGLSGRYASVANPVRHMTQTAQFVVNEIRSKRRRNYMPSSSGTCPC